MRTMATSGHNPKEDYSRWDDWHPDIYNDLDTAAFETQQVNEDSALIIYHSATERNPSEWVQSTTYVDTYDYR